MKLKNEATYQDILTSLASAVLSLILINMLPIYAAIWVWSQAIPYENFCGQNATETSSIRMPQFSCIITLSSLLHSYIHPQSMPYLDFPVSSPYHRCCILISIHNRCHISIFLHHHLIIVAAYLSPSTIDAISRFSCIITLSSLLHTYIHPQSMPYLDFPASSP